MNKFSALLIAIVASCIAACSSTPTKPAPAAAPIVANFADNWVVTTVTPMGAQDSKMLVKQIGNDLTGTLESEMGSVNFIGVAEGINFKIWFSFNAQGTDLRIDYIGALDGQNTIKGIVKFGSLGEGTFTAKRL